MNSLLDKTEIGFGMEAQGLFLVCSTVILLIIFFLDDLCAVGELAL